MDLYMMILRFLFGMPVESGQLEPILVHADRRASSGRQRLATQHGIQNITGASTPWQHLMQAKPDLGFRGRLTDLLYDASRRGAQWQDHRRTARN